jgi:DNA-binding CsgD family transcriptional regulator
MLDRMLAGRTGLSPVMVGRTSPLSRLTGLMATSAREPAVALVVGEAGVGKTRLLRELVRSLPQGVQVLAGQAEPGSLGRPFELALDALGLDAVPDTPDRLAAVVQAYLDRVANGPAVIIFEDLHWADAESLGVFERLASGTPLGAMLIGSYRSDELSRFLPAADLLVRLDRRRTVHHLWLDRLTQPEVAHFLACVFGRPLPSKTTDALHARTGGNPFFLEEILSAAGDAEPEALAVQPLPFTLAEIVRRQLDGLSGDERRVIDAAAVLGRGASFDVLAAVTRMNEQELIGHLRGLVDRGLITEDRPDEFVFRHALVRDAVEDQLLGRERRRLHEAALAALRESGSADIAGLAKHALGAGRYDEFLDLAQEGATYYLERGSSYQALRLATDALVEDPDCLTLLETATRAAWLVGLNDEAFGHARRWRERAEARGDLAAQAEAAHMLTRLVRDLARVDELDAALADLEHLTSRLPAGPERARAYAAVAQAHMLAHRSELAVEWSDRAIEEAERWDAKPVRALAMVEKGSALAGWAGHRDEALVTIREAVAEAEAVGDHVAVARGLHNMLECVSLHTREGKAIVAALDSAAERAGYDAMIRTKHEDLQVEIALSEGDMARAQAGLDSWVRRVGEVTPSEAQWPALNQVSVWLEEGRTEEAAALAGRAVDLTTSTHPWELAVAVQLAGRTGRREDVEPLLRRLCAAATTEPDPPNVEWTVLPADAALRAGVAPAVVREVLGPMQELAREAPWYPLGEALVVAAEGDHRNALERLDSVLSHPEPEVPAYVLAAAWLTAARSHLALGERTEAFAAASRARALLERWPGFRRDEVDALLRRLDRVTTQEDSDLTAREREVAALVSQGLTNGAIAKELYISPRTAAVHVSNILAKLGLANRSELTAWAVRSGLVRATE